MRALILNGASGPDPLLDDLATGVAGDFAARGYSAEQVRLRDIPIAYCQGCFECWTHTPGTCKIDDDGRDLSRDFALSDVVVLVTPVRFGSYSWQTKKLLDRTLGTLLPFFHRIDGEVHHFPRYPHRPALGVLAVLHTRDPEEETTVKVLAQRNSLNFATPTHDVAIVHRDESLDASLAQCHALVAHLTAADTLATALRIRPVDDLLPWIDVESESLPPQRALLLVGSAKPRGTSTSEALGMTLMEQLAMRGIVGESRHVQRAAHSPESLREFVAAVRSTDLLVIASPIYIDALPALVTQCLEAIADDRNTMPTSRPLTVAMILNCGFPEARHASLTRTIGALFARSVGAHWAGALQLGGGGAINGQPLEQAGSVARHLPHLLDNAAAALAAGHAIASKTIEAFACPLMPTALYIVAADLGWVWTAAHEDALTRLWARPANSSQ